MNATSEPSRDTRRSLSQPPVSYSILPIGYSIRVRPPTFLITARFVPSADQSADCTSSRTARGAPADSGTRDRVPVPTYVPERL